MAWFTAGLVASYIGICEYRAPAPWQSCEPRWNLALGVLVPSPATALAKLVTQRRRSASSTPKEPPVEG